jgi:ABC-type polar amino acid transport system ATPase subunit
MRKLINTPVSSVILGGILTFSCVGTHSNETKKKPSNVTPGEWSKQASIMLKNVDLKNKGAQQQRMNIIQALVANPQLILADEPPSALDSPTFIGRNIKTWEKKN